ncbi:MULTISPECIES: SlyX family protein [Colwelliaceae]|uniref:SlyX family protein n=1 Tax=Colwelliaceae TaxID=267889 RepID=UPI001FE81599|nr:MULTISPECIES: SlyX family protein [Colwelliaceae]
MANKIIMPETNLEQRIEALESRNAFQDDVIEQLNDEITVHQSQIAELQHQLTLIAARIKDSSTPQQSSEQDIEPPPPHY